MTRDELAARGVPELLPCPFCGGNDPLALNIEHMAGTIIHPAYRVTCDNCGGASGWTDRGDHVEMWNRRATPAALAEAPEVAKLIREAYATARQMISAWGNDDGPDLLGPPDTDYGRGWLDAISYAQSQIRTLEAAALRGKETT